MTLVTALTLAVTLTIYFTARWYFGTNRNMFTILAALCCVGVGKAATDMAMFYRAGCCSEAARDNIEMHLGRLQGLYDLFLTSYNKNFQISHIAVAGREVCALTETKDCDIRAAEQHIRAMMEQDGFRGYRIRIFRNLDQYLDSLDELGNIEDEKERKSNSGVLDLLLSISL